MITDSNTTCYLSADEGKSTQPDTTRDTVAGCTERVETGSPRSAATGNGRPEKVFATPEPWPDPVHLASVLDAMVRLLRRHVAFTEHDALTVALWTVFTYVFDAARVSPILNITSPEKGCGKSTLLGLVSELVHRPLTGASLTAAVIYRLIEKHCPTLLMDEVDTSYRCYAHAIPAQLSGIRRGAVLVHAGVTAVCSGHAGRRGFVSLGASCRACFDLSVACPIPSHTSLN
jgi:hypothetical protein